MQRVVGVSTVRMSTVERARLSVPLLRTPKTRRSQRASGATTITRGVLTRSLTAPSPDGAEHRGVTIDECPRINCPA